MSLTGHLFLALTVLLFLAVPTALILTWNRVRGPHAARWTVRIALTLLSQGAAVLAVLVWVNDNYGLYDSWTDLFGGTGQVQMNAAGGGAGGDNAGRPVPGAATTGRRLTLRPWQNGVLQADATGPRSHITGDLYVWLPPQYNQPQFRRTRFPVLELLPGYPGTPKAWYGAMKAEKVAQQEIMAGRMRPTILVSAKLNVLGRVDPGCADLPNGSQTATWLGQDVPSLIKSTLRTSDRRTQWAVMGYSAGAYCAVNLTLHYPGTFGAAVSLSGYNAPISPLVDHDAALARANNPFLILRDHPHNQPRVNLLMAGSLQDGDTVFAARSLLGELHNKGASRLLTISKGGHNTKVWEEMLPNALLWTSAQMR
ncbi:hypothetical protein BIV57_22705 [Mangrovactinospora gilvigrisea]|uniref:Esterase n=1 Tax=Mangrovactinospora gilvigrisea TaxID=1428644 RepID=A0A1J7B9A4_9ACTN|nr:alpha/beta hydrolase-fold protein [Mangrovactinospora gilvigrisea]OIV35227.1 hypothetical protein BIV57_22705 [Mangrovactinospora gilvigrisea]